MDEQVNIPALLLFSEGGTQVQGLSALWYVRFRSQEMA
jgi:hypothetical protein